MTFLTLVEAMLILRRALRPKSELLKFSNEQWREWLLAQQKPSVATVRPQLVIVAALTCMDDLLFHVGAMQLLGIQGLSCHVILTVPTDEMAMILKAQARREEWNGLVLIVSDRDSEAALARLPAQSRLAVFRFPSVITRANVAALIPDAGIVTDRTICSDENMFLGDAGEYSVWRSSQKPINDRQLRSALQSLTRQPSDNLTAQAAIDTQEQPESKWSALSATIHESIGRVEIPDVNSVDELIITAMERSTERKIVLKQACALYGFDDTVRVRMPASMITTGTQRVRVTCREPDQTNLRADLTFHVPPARIRPWMVSAFLNRGGGGNPVMRAFAAGLNCRLAYAEDEPDTLHDIPAVWGVLRQSDRIILQALAQSFYYFYIDHAYFNRGHGGNYRITRNGYEAGPVRDWPVTRFKDLGIEVHPWRKSGREIVVCPPTSYFMKAHGCSNWLDDTLATLRRFTDRPISVRLKPERTEHAPSLECALASAHALVTHSSNVAIEAACLGTPVFVAPTSAAAPIGHTDLSKIEAPIFPSRMPWLAHLAYNQFTLEEIQSGRAWRYLLELEDRDFV